MLRLKHLTRSRLTALHSLAGLQACSSLGSFAPRNDVFGFTLAEVLITLGIIGVVAALTMPSLLGNSKEAELVTGLLKFHSTLSQAVMQWRNDTGMIDIANTDADAAAFDAIAEKLRFTAKCVGNECAAATWLPDYTLNYYGEKNAGVSYGAVAKHGYGNVCYLLNDGMTFCLDINPTDYCVTVDVNGKKNPNRVGQDTFHFTVGYKGHDVTIGELHSSTNVLNEGLCTLSSAVQCDPDNIDPAQKGGAFPTAYVLTKKKLPPKYSR